MQKTVLNIIVFYFVLMNNIIAQNLVPNSSFEMHSGCPNGLGGISLHLADFWDGFDSSDYFSTCSTDSESSIPSNLLGYQQALTDTSYAGILFYVPTTNPVSSEFIQVQLTGSLVREHYYCVSFYVSLADSSDYAISSIGAYFSDTAVSLLQLEDSTIIPQVENSADSILNDKINWRRVSGYYYAAGGENFLTIGNFFTNANTISQYLGGGASSYDAAYYYIDDVSVTLCDSLFASVNEISSSSKINNIRLYPNPNDGNMTLEYQLNENEKGLFIIYDVTGKQLQSYNFNAGSSQLSINADTLHAGVYLYDVFINNVKAKTDRIVIVK